MRISPALRLWRTRYAATSDFKNKEIRIVVMSRLFRRRAEPDVQLDKGLEKTRRGVFSEITRLFDRSAIDEELFEELEMLLIQADVGWDVSQQLVEDLRERVRRDRIDD